MEFKRQIITTRWPDKSSILPFYEHYIVGRPYEKHFTKYSIIKEKSLNISEQEEAMQMLRDTTLIEDNFARVDFYLGSTTLVTMTDTKKYSQTDLFSTLGGTLNLYSGITFVIIIELFELLFLIFYRKSAEKKQQEEINENAVVPIKRNAFERTEYSKEEDFSQRY